ncbi:MAG: lipid A deacylase LpxR family protein [Bacteroidota bacterium]|nr:lipid A deacylase LpxR family protein [Bacteroidota bacterium]
MKLLITVILSCFVLPIVAQPPAARSYSQEFSVVTDNDAYLLQGSDRYYTNGLFLTYRKAYQKKADKLLREYQLAQTIFTPYYAQVFFAEEIDRSFCGYLFGKYSQTHFYANGQAFQWYASLGTIGTNSLAENLQNGIHKLEGLYSVIGWHYQVQEAFAVNTGFSYTPSAIVDNSGTVKLSPAVEAELGSVFINAKAGTYLCIGKFAKNSESVLYNAVVSTDKTAGKHRELFFYLFPQLIVQGYNATVQGNLFGNKSGTITKTPETFVFKQTIGLAFAKERWSSKLEAVLQTKECTTQFQGHAWGSLQFAYRFH